MKLSKHTYDSDVFQNLLNNVKPENIQKTAQTSPVSGSDIFTTRTSNDLDNVVQDMHSNAISELEFAASRSKVALADEHRVSFAKSAYKLTGKDLERAAQKFCGVISQEVFSPQQAMKLSSNTMNNIHSVASATYSPDAENGGVNFGRTGGYMGMQSNPNTIFEPDAIVKKAQTKLGDETIQERKEAIQKQKEEDKKMYWESIQKQASEDSMIHNAIKNAGTYAESPVVDINFGSNTMSIFSNDRDFSNIPEQTLGEKIASIASDRASKHATSDKEYTVKPTQKIDSNSVFNSLFNNG